MGIGDKRHKKTTDLYVTGPGFGKKSSVLAFSQGEAISDGKRTVSPVGMSHLSVTE